MKLYTVRRDCSGKLSLKEHEAIERKGTFSLPTGPEEFGYRVRIRKDDRRIHRSAQDAFEFELRNARASIGTAKAKVEAAEKHLEELTALAREKGMVLP
jgi:hypothetical protein